MASNNNKLKKIQRFRLLCFLNNEITQLILGNCPLMCDKVYDLMGTGRWFSIVKMPFAVTLMDMKLRFKKAKGLWNFKLNFPAFIFQFRTSLHKVYQNANTTFQPDKTLPQEHSFNNVINCYFCFINCNAKKNIYIHNNSKKAKEDSKKEIIKTFEKVCPKI